MQAQSNPASDQVSVSRTRLDEAMARQGQYLVNAYTDGDQGAEFEVREYGDALDGRAFTVDLTTGAIDETDR